METQIIWIHSGASASRGRCAGPEEPRTSHNNDTQLLLSFTVHCLLSKDGCFVLIFCPPHAPLPHHHRGDKTITSTRQGAGLWTNHPPSQHPNSFRSSSSSSALTPSSSSPAPQPCSPSPSRVRKQPHILQERCSLCLTSPSSVEAQKVPNKSLIGDHYSINTRTDTLTGSFRPTRGAPGQELSSGIRFASQTSDHLQWAT